jgi:hypothetical protein
MDHLLDVPEEHRVDELTRVDVEVVQHDHALYVAAPPAPALDFEEVVLEPSLQTPCASQVHDASPYASLGDRASSSDR